MAVASTDATAALVERALVRDEPEAGDTRGRIMLAALRECEDVGLRRTTMEDIARRAQLARVTLYRHFPSKDALVRAVIVEETDRFFGALDAALDGLDAVDDRVCEGFAFALEYIRRHALLQRLLRAEPETLLPYLLGDSTLIAIARAAAAARIDAAGRDLEVEAEIVVRLVLSLALSPQSVLGVDAPEGARRFARRYLCGGLQPPLDEPR